MAENWILNASPLIVLARIGQEELILTLADQVVVPRAVVTEIEAGPTQDKARQILVADQFAIVDSPPPSPELLSWDLGSGEIAVLSLAMAERMWVAILDDAAARKCARSFSIPIKGTLAIVLMAKQRGLISSAAGVIQCLVDEGFRIDDRIVREALARMVGEEWPV